MRNRTDDYFTEGWVNDQLKLEEALNVIKIETIEQGSLDIINQIKQLEYSPHNYRLMALIKLAQLNQGSFSTKENITEVEDKEEWTEQVLSGLKDAKETAEEFLLGKLPESFKDIVMFCGGFSDRVLTNLFPGSNFMNEPYEETLKIPYYNGVITGDIVSMVGGVLATIWGADTAITDGAAVVAGTAVTVTGVGAAPGVAIDAVGIGAVITGVAVAGVGVNVTLSAYKNIGEDKRKLQEIKDKISIRKQIEKIRTKTPEKLLSEGWEDITDPRMKANTTSRELYNPQTGLKIRFDKGVEGANGFEGVDHYHIFNNNYTNKKIDYYFDIDGNPVGKGSKASHIIIEGD
jgi:hypothetical protein